MFSIVVPLYNKEAFIRRCIDSVLSQTSTDYELIVVDDGSTDRSLSIISSYDDERIKIITQGNKGAGPARNRGVVESSGEWIAFLDADDVWGKDHLEELGLLVEGFEDAGIVSTKSTEVDTNQILIASINAKDRKWKRKIVDYFRCAASRNGMINSSNVAIRRTVFDKVGFFKNLKQGEDTEFWSRVCLSYPYASSNKPTSFYCRGTGGIMEKIWELNIDKQMPVNSIRDIGPAVSLLVDELEGGNVSKELRNCVVTFINSRITTALKIRLYSGRIDGMSLISGFYMNPLSFRYWAWKKLSGMPSWFLIGLYGVRDFVRSIYRLLMKKSAK